MATLRNMKIKAIKDIIHSDGQFSIDDFEFEFPESAYHLAKITFRAMPKYSFSIEENRSVASSALSTLGLFHNTESKKPEEPLKIIECPGEYKNLQVTTHRNIDDCIEQLDAWLYRLHVDLEHIDQSATNENLADDFFSKIDEMIDNPEERFAAEEKEHILKVLNELQERVKQLEEAQQLSNEIATKTNSVIEISKKTLQTYPKRAWIITTYNKLKGVNGAFKTAIELKEHFGKILEWSSSLIS